MRGGGEIIGVLGKGEVQIWVLGKGEVQFWIREFWGKGGGDSSGLRESLGDRVSQHLAQQHSVWV